MILGLSCTCAQLLIATDTHIFTRYCTELQGGRRSDISGRKWASSFILEARSFQHSGQLLADGPQCIDSFRLCSLGELRLMFDKLAMRDLTLCA